MIRSTRLLIALAVLASLALIASIAGADTWDVGAQFSAVNNPNGAWSYGWAWGSSFPSGYTMNVYGSPLAGPWGGTNAWNIDGTMPSHVGQPFVIYNSNAGAAFILEGKRFYSDAGGGTGNAEMKSVTRFTAPTNGDYSYSGLFRDVSGESDFHLIKNATTHLADGNVASGTASEYYYAKGYVALTQNDTLDFVTGVGTTYSVPWEYVRVDATLKSGKWGISGNVKDAGLANVSGAKVEIIGGADSAITDASGNYTIIAIGEAAGTYSVKASKAGQEPATQTGVVIDGVTPATVNFTLPAPAVVSGTVRENTPTALVVQGVTVTTMDGLYSATTNTAGYYSMPVSRGAYKLRFYKLGYLTKFADVNVTDNMTQDISLDTGWNLASDWHYPTNPLGGNPWSYYWEDSTAVPVTMNTGFGTWADSNCQGYCVTSQFLGTTYYKNITTNAFEGTVNLGSIYCPPLSLIISGGTYHSNPAYNWPTRRAHVRFVVPTAGFYDITARFAGGRTDRGTGNPTKGTYTSVTLNHGSTTLFTGNIAGFGGRAANNYTDSIGATPVLTYETQMDLGLNETLDILIPYEGSVISDLTIAKTNNVITGRVTCGNLPGAPGIEGASVGLSGDTSYDAVTDANGYYLMSVKSGVYDVTVSKVHYGTYVGSVNVATNTTTTKNVSINHGLVWDLALDFSQVANPSERWSYGYIQTTGAAPDRGFTLYSNCYTFGSYYKPGVPIWGSAIPDATPTPKWGSLGKNCGATPSNNSTGFAALIESGDTYWSDYAEGYQGKDTACIRWTAPDERIVQIYYSIKPQNPAPGSYTYPVNLCNDGVKMVTRTATGFAGFAGTSANGYTDSIAAVGPLAIPTFQTTIPVTTGQRIDFVAGADDWQHGFVGSVGLTATITTVDSASAATCHTVADILAQPVGKIVFMVTPINLVSATQTGFRRYGDPASTQRSFYVQSDDRLQGLKLMCDASTPTYPIGWKITFSGTIAMVDGQKVVVVSSINSAVQDTAPMAIGKGSKSVTANGTLVKVWGRITNLVPNTYVDPEDAGAAPQKAWTYEYMTINDGGVQITVPMHIQYTWMSTWDPPVAALSVGDYVAVTGIATTAPDGTLIVVPRGMGGGYSDIVTYEDVP